MDGELRLFKEDIKDEVSSRQWIDRHVVTDDENFLSAGIPMEIGVIRHGHWIKGENCNGIYEWQCSVCKRGWTHRTDKDICDEKYCYNCGAKMDEVNDETN